MENAFEQKPLFDNNITDSKSSLNQMMKGNFLEFASYVIKERAIPHIDDGLKPVQRRILYTLHKNEDGRFHKVANLVGNCMQLHPHGDSSIYSALVNLANKEYFLEKQGNFGNILTGDNAAAARYIEARLTPLAKDYLFNKEITKFIDSYDGRNQEPTILPVKLPVLLMLGTEGIAVGMATKVFPHNFIELLKAQIQLIKNKPIILYPDFLQAGLMNISEYDNGWGKITLRAKIEQVNNKTIIIREIPYGTNTESIINSIEKACNSGKIKISTINDYTADKIEIELKVPRGFDTQTIIKGLYAFTDCQISLNSNIVGIENNKPISISTEELLFKNTQTLIKTLCCELAIDYAKLKQQLHDRTLEQIFIEEKIYRYVEKCTSAKEINQVVKNRLKDFSKQIILVISPEDIERLLRIPIRKISSFDREKNKQDIKNLQEKIAQKTHSLKNLQEYAIDFLQKIIQKYKKQYSRKTQISIFESINIKKVAIDNLKLGFDKKNGFIGYNIKCENTISCNEFDRFVIIKNNGTLKVFDSINEKNFVGKFSYIFKVNKEHIYSSIYLDKKTQLSYIKRFKIKGFILNKEYKIIPDNCKITLLEEAQGIEIHIILDVSERIHLKELDISFSDVDIRSMTSRGLRIAKKPIKKIHRTKRGSLTKSIQEKNGTENQDNIKIKKWHTQEKLHFNSQEYIEQFIEQNPQWKKTLEEKIPRTSIEAKQTIPTAQTTLFDINLNE